MKQLFKDIDNKNIILVKRKSKKLKKSVAYTLNLKRKNAFLFLQSKSIAQQNN